MKITQRSINGYLKKNRQHVIITCEDIGGGTFLFTGSFAMGANVYQGATIVEFDDTLIIEAESLVNGLIEGYEDDFNKVLDKELKVS